MANARIHSDASSASNYVLLMDGLTAKEVQTVWIMRLDDTVIGNNPMANLTRRWTGSGDLEGNINPGKAILSSMMLSLFGSFGNNNINADDEEALNNYNKILIEEESEDVCVGSPRENRNNIIGNNEDDNKEDNEICLRIQGADLRRFDKYKKRLHLTTAPPWYKKRTLKQKCIEVGWVSIPSYLLLYTMHLWSCRGYTGYFCRIRNMFGRCLHVEVELFTQCPGAVALYLDGKERQNIFCPYSYRDQVIY